MFWLVVPPYPKELRRPRCLLSPDCTRPVTSARTLGTIEMSATHYTSAIARSRVGLLIASWLYAYAIHYAHVMYLNPEWDYFGFSYRPLGATEIVIIGALVSIGALLLPLVLDRPSSIIVLALFAVVYVPTVVVSLSLEVDRIDLYGPGLITLAFAFGTACIGARVQRTRVPVPGSIPGQRLQYAIFALWLICCAILVATYYPIMRFAGIEETYEQRAAGTATDLLLGYTQTYFGNVFSPALVALGLVRSRRSLVVLGTIGCVIMYLITAQRTILLLPIAIIGLYFALTSTSLLPRTASFIIIVLSAAVWVSVANYADSVAASFLSLFLVSRTLGLPGLTFSQYYDVFGSVGFTWWSHVRGLDLLIPVPESLVNDEAWPRLGNVVGEHVYNRIDVNAHCEPVFWRRSRRGWCLRGRCNRHRARLLVILAGPVQRGLGQDICSIGHPAGWHRPDERAFLYDAPVVWWPFLDDSFLRTQAALAKPARHARPLVTSSRADQQLSVLGRIWQSQRRRTPDQLFDGILCDVEQSVISRPFQLNDFKARLVEIADDMTLASEYQVIRQS